MYATLAFSHISIILGQHGYPAFFKHNTGQAISSVPKITNQPALLYEIIILKSITDNDERIEDGTGMLLDLLEL